MLNIINPKTKIMLTINEEIKENPEFKLDGEYVLWYHSVLEKKWTADSYINLCQDIPEKSVSTAKQLWEVYDVLENNFTAGMFFLMRKGIMPTWEDPQNSEGGFWSYKVPKKKSNISWKQLSAGFVGNSLTANPENIQYITGISISPKISNCVIKIWNNTSEMNDCSILTKEIDCLDPTTIRYNKHKK